MRIIFFLLIFVVINAKSITIFAASDLKFALDNIKSEFLKNKNDKIDIIYGSSGRGMQQILAGAPYHIYFSANIKYVDILYNKQAVITKPKLYAVGKIVLWSKNPNFKSEIGFDNLTKTWVRKIAIANPLHAPYGQKAKEALENIGLYAKLRGKIVFGDNISATAGYVHAKAVDIGVVALSLVQAPNIKNSKFNKYYLIDNKLYKPLKQAYSITRYGAKSSLAKEFYNFLQTKKSIAILKKFGFIIDN